MMRVSACDLATLHCCPRERNGHGWRAGLDGPGYSSAEQRRPRRVKADFLRRMGLLFQTPIPLRVCPCAGAFWLQQRKNVEILLES